MVKVLEEVCYCNDVLVVKKREKKGSDEEL